ncbi:hypothetical protein [Candidatus Protochlamydia amoebophila]|uniref:Uncharacterized protein n=1 Tax=Protochlamydia amoebophila (strain UWE25) TaxID=264201 RepID=Q6M9Q4_PARUW|nr:hypothetical protein [Candidatus Protochlamydia amoebophila]CAF24695.1 unnamed protein product [Candidatus Protochlamydia amoebophila UWE25]
MINLNGLQFQANLLMSLSKTLKKEDLNLDHLDIIDSYIGRTKLKTTFIYEWLKEHRNLAMQESTHPKFYIIKQDFANHLDKRIATLKFYLSVQDKKFQECIQKGISSNELWQENSKKENTNEVDLLNISMQIQDLLFTCEEVITYLTPQAKDLTKKEINPFIEKSLPVYLNLLPTTFSSDLKEDIQKNFKKLEELIVEEDFEKAKDQLAKTKEQIKANCVYVR